MDPGTATLMSTALNVGGGLFSQSSARNAYQHRYQDTVKDMRKAGLNPALAYGQNPGGGAQTHDFGDVGSQAASAYQASAAGRQARAQTELTTAQANLLKAQTDDLKRRTFWEAERSIFDSRRADYEADSAGTRRTVDRDTAASKIQSARQAAELERLMLPEARAMAKYYDQTGTASPYLNTAAQLLRMLIEGRGAMRGRIIPKGARVE